LAYVAAINNMPTTHKALTRDVIVSWTFLPATLTRIRNQVRTEERSWSLRTRS